MVMRRPEAVADSTIDLWRRLAAELVSIIGEGGFQSLFSRSVQLTSADFPWIAPIHAHQRLDSEFPDLKSSLTGRDFTEASEASIGLLVTFCDILAVLIGDVLTNRILGSAWGDDALGVTEKEVLS